MDDRSLTVPRWSVVRVCESSRHQRQLLAQVYQQVFAQVRRPLSSSYVVVGPCHIPTDNRTAARVAAGA
jgi:hypothetical protein